MIEKLKKKITKDVKKGLYDTCFYRFDIEDYFTIKPMLENCFDQLDMDTNDIMVPLIDMHKKEIADLFEELYNNSEPDNFGNNLIHNDY